MYLAAQVNVVDPLGIAILLVVLGAGLVVAEVLIPSAGILGFLSAISFLAAIYFAYVDGGISQGVTFAVIEVLLAPVLLFFAFKLLPNTPIGKILLGEAPRAEDVMPQNPRQSLVGKIGVARSPMLPSGAIEIDGQVIDAVSQGSPIDPGQQVKIVEVRGNRVMVRPVKASDATADDAPEARKGDLLNRPAAELGLEDFDLEGDKPA